MRKPEPSPIALRLAAARAWMLASLRSLFPPISMKRLSFRGGIFALPIYVLLISIYPLSLQQAEWVRTAEHFTWLAFVAILVGTVVGNGSMSARRAALFGGVVGAIAIVLTTTMATEGPVFRERLVRLAVSVNNWITQVMAGEAASDPTAFVLFLGATVWSSTFVGSFALSRSIRLWDAIVFTGFCLVVNVSMALTNLIADLVVFSLAALVLLVRLHIVALQARWERQNIVPSGEMDWRLLRGGLTWTTVLVIMALVTPRVGAAEVLNRAYNVFESPYHRVESEWQRFFAGVSGPSKLRGVTFTESIRLGQAPNLGDRVVMTVDAPTGHFWRALTYDFYTGNGWRTTETDRIDKISAPVLGREKFDATFEMDSAHQNLLFGANEPVRANIPFQFQSGADHTYSTSMRAIRTSQTAQPYTVTSYVSVADKAQLRRASTTYPDYIRLKYLQLPSTLPQRVRDLAHKAAGDQADAYDKAEALEQFLRGTVYKYAPTVRAPPPGRDPVDYFLFDLKEDFCEYFASSMVVMLRELGVPARVVEGYTTGSLDPTSGKFVVKELDAHAWVEVYFPLYGWIEFEPTPSQAPFLRLDSDAVGGNPGGDSDLNGDPNSRLAREDADLANGPDAGDGEGFGSSGIFAQNFDPVPLILVLLAIALIILLAFARFQIRFRGQPTVDAAWGKAKLLASYAGYHAHPSQTTYEYAAMLGQAVPDAKGPIVDIAEARVRDRYTPAGATAEDVERARSAWRRLARTLIGMLPTRLVNAIARIWR